MTTPPTGLSRFGPVSDATPPSVPGGLAATPAAFSVALTWTASTDNVGIGGYDVFRGGSLVASLGNLTSYTDTTVAAVDGIQLHRARSGHLRAIASAQSAPLPVTTPASAAPPVFADGFESGDLFRLDDQGWAWRLTDQRRPKRHVRGRGQRDREPPPAPRRPSGATYPDAYARVGVEIDTSTEQLQVTLLRLRDAAGAGDFGYVYLTAGGKLAFHNDLDRREHVERHLTGRRLARSRAAPRRQRGVEHRRSLA